MTMKMIGLKYKSAYLDVRKREYRRSSDLRILRGKTVTEVELGEKRSRKEVVKLLLEDSVYAEWKVDDRL